MVAAAFEVGEFWSKTTQIDVVGLRDDGWTDLGECKWGRVRSARKAEEALEQKVRAYPNRRNASIGRHLFVRATPTPAAKHSDHVAWHCLQDLYR